VSRDLISGRRFDRGRLSDPVGAVADLRAAGAGDLAAALDRRHAGSIIFDRSDALTGRVDALLRATFGSGVALWQPYLKATSGGARTASTPSPLRQTPSRPSAMAAPRSRLAALREDSLAPSASMVTPRITTWLITYGWVARQVETSFELTFSRDRPLERLAGIAEHFERIGVAGLARDDR
jgi:hypothetical protein